MEKESSGNIAQGQNVPLRSQELTTNRRFRALCVKSWPIFPLIFSENRWAPKDVARPKFDFVVKKSQEDEDSSLDSSGESLDFNLF